MTRFEVCRALEEHKDEIIAEYRAHMGGAAAILAEDATEADVKPTTTVKGWLAKATELSDRGLVLEEDIDDAMDDDSPSQ